jgi:hypothetical protein
MEIKEFVSTVIVSLVQGVEDAQIKLQESEAVVNPLGVSSSIAILNNRIPPCLTNIEFEVAVEVKDSEDIGGGIGVKIAGVFNSSVTAKKGRLESHVSKLRFSVPILLPPDKLIK